MAASGTHIEAPSRAERVPRRASYQADPIPGLVLQQRRLRRQQKIARG